MLGLAGIVTFIVTVACCEYAEAIGRRLHVIDRPDGARKVHGAPTPLAGGVALAGPLAVLVLLQFSITPERAPFLTALLVAGLGCLVLGYADDRWTLRPAVRLAVAGLLFAGVAFFVPALRLTELDMESQGLWKLGMLAMPMTVLCAVTFLNAVNMADGRNGVVLGMSICWLYGLGCYAPLALLPFFLFFIVCLVVVFMYNMAGRLFLGDSGSYLLAAVIGLISIRLYNLEPGLPLALAILWFLVPVLDCLRLIVTRVRAGRSPFSADSDHLHHHLGRRLPWRRALPVYLALAAGPGFLGTAFPALAGEILVVVPFVYGVVLRWAMRVPRPAEEKVPAMASQR
ncbi:MraY family glycosyltransferase [Geminicoccaceae bacterium 1502E]|nr:MraY family glycosyltransferase [Geminicoccaceae bacterium 1502E]